MNDTKFYYQWSEKAKAWIKIYETNVKEKVKKLIAIKQHKQIVTQ